MEQKKTPLKGKRLIFFSLLFGLFMVLIGYFIFNSADSSNITSLNKDVKMKNAQQLFDKGMMYYDQKKYEQASKCFSESLDNGFLIAHALLGECKLHLGQYDEAEKHLIEASKINDGESFLKGYYSGVEYNLGVVYYSKKNMENAKKHLINAKKLGNTQADEILAKL
ncbi:tetratricopeptide repeat protein [Pedobacter mendelii]|uniref:Tetratricopeptide repeat protein n=1 Tax=Pedobacter mendelii TaxID=1908240 RepID=A0ABQ2BMJ6_9SPHI|nr:tetratricopeptide repeat protein [Pedobacter mendelii]GGI29517.1 hypothetical protein GCM10008119_38020 [Pedobacter mendelii]